MFYYSEKLPLKDTVVLARIIIEEENDTCVYVKLPEYNNFRGLICKSELPKKARTQKKILDTMRKNGLIVCTVSKTSHFDSNNNPILIELSVKGVDEKHHPNVISRHKNIEKILRVIKFVSKEFDKDYEKLIHNFHQSDIRALTIKDFDDIEEIDNYTTTYFNYLKNYDIFLKKMQLDENLPIVSSTIKNIINETNASSGLEFELTIWKSNSNIDVIYLLQNVFDHIKKIFPNIELRYVGAPKYQVYIISIEFEKINELYENIKEEIVHWMEINNVTRYDLKFDCSNKDVKRGEITIAFPYKVKMD